MIVLTALFSFSLFIGYLIGRTGHFICGHKIDFLHHWIYGLILIAVGFIIQLENSNLEWGISMLGLGVFISDIKDFVNLKFYGRDTHPVRKFWGFD